MWPSSRYEGNWNREKWEVQTTMPWAVCSYLLEAGRTGQAGGHTGTPPEGGSKVTSTSAAKGQGPPGDLSGPLEDQNGPLGSIEKLGFCIYSFNMILS